MRPAIRGLSQLTGWKWRTKAESPLARRAKRVFADARTRVLLHSYSWSFFGRLIGDRSIVFRRRKSEQLSKARFVRFARRTITVGLNPFWMLYAQRVVYLSLKLGVRTDLVGPPRKSIHFHNVKKSALNRSPLFRVRRIFDYHSRGGSRSLFRDRTASAAADALQSQNWAYN